jgi:HK97 gp10 family phage protein
VPFKVEGKFEGLEQLVSRLTGLKTAMKNKILRRATLKASRVVAKRAKALCPVRLTEKQQQRQIKSLKKKGIAAPTFSAAAAKNIEPAKVLKKSIIAKVKADKRGGGVIGLIGPKKGKIKIGQRIRKGKKSNVGDPIYEDASNIAHFVELGTKRSRARPFLRPALKESRSEIESIFAAEVRAGLEEAARGK